MNVNAQDVYNFLLNTRDGLQNQMDDIDDALDVIRSGGSLSISSRRDQYGYNDVGTGFRGTRSGGFVIPSLSRRGRMSGAGSSRYDEDVETPIGDIRSFDQHISNVVSHSIRSTLREVGFRGNIGGSGTGGGNGGGGTTSYTDDQLTDILNSAKRNPSDSDLIDMSTQEGRTLLGAGWCDNDGHVLVEFEEAGSGGRGNKGGGKQGKR